ASSGPKYLRKMARAIARSNGSTSAWPRIPTWWLNPVAGSQSTMPRAHRGSRFRLAGNDVPPMIQTAWPSQWNQTGDSRGPWSELWARWAYNGRDRNSSRSKRPGPRRRRSSRRYSYRTLQAAAQELLIGTGGGQAQGFLPGVCGGGMLAQAEMELTDDDVPAGIAGGDDVLGNGGQAVESSLRAVQGSFGDRAVEGVQRRRRDAIERVVQFGDPSPIGVGEGRCAAVLPCDAGFDVIARQLVAGGRPGEPRHAFADVAPVPGRAILFLEENNGAVE